MTIGSGGVRGLHRVKGWFQQRQTHYSGRLKVQVHEVLFHKLQIGNSAALSRPKMESVHSLETLIAKLIIRGAADEDMRWFER